MKALTLRHARKRVYLMLFGVTLFLFLYFCCCATVYSTTVEHRCIYDRIAEKAGPPSTAAVLRLPRRKRSAVQLLAVCESEWKPIRFSVFIEDLNNGLRHCGAVGQTRSNFEGGTVSCKAENILTDAKRNIIVNQVLPRATKLHSERLLVEPVTHPILVPNNMSGACSNFTVPSSHHTKGVENADMVLYVAAGPIETGILAWAVPCAVLENGRFAVGVININPSEASSQEYFVRVAAHEIGHTLGFGSFAFKRAGIVSLRTGVRGKENVTLMDSTKVVEKTRAHYNCPTALGMELEDEGGGGTVGSHWETRNAKDELMSPFSSAGYYSALTMAAFEDMGYFRANWSMAETMNWGRNAGCDLLEKKCVTYGTTAYPDMFCTGNNGVGSVLTCTSDCLALGYCLVETHKNFLPSQFQYFDDPRVGGPSGTLTDHCPIILPNYLFRCAEGIVSVMPGSIVSPFSRCLKGKNLYFDDKVRIGDVCAEVKCHENSCDVSVRYFGSSAWHLCPEGESIELRGLLKGRILCPKYSEVCYETGKDKSEVDLGPMRANPRENETEQTRMVTLFLPGKTKVYEKTGGEVSEMKIKYFDSPILVSADDVMVALVDADGGYGENASNGVAARYVGTEKLGWVKKVTASNGSNWATPVALPKKDKQENYYFYTQGSMAVGRGNKIYVLVVSYKKNRTGIDDTEYVDWGFEVVVGEVKFERRWWGARKTIDWKTPVTLSAVNQKFKEQLFKVPQYRERYGFLTKDGGIIFVAEALKNNKLFFVIIYSRRGETEIEWEGAYFEAAEGCRGASFFEWDGKLILLPQRSEARCKVKESTDMGRTWTDAGEPVVSIFENLRGKRHFTPAKIENKNVLFFTESIKEGRGRGPHGMYLWMTDGVCARKIGLITSVYDSYSVIFSGLLYTNGELFSIHPYSDPHAKSGVFVLRLKDGLERVKHVLNPRN